jgi:hypothetical protein
MKMEFDELDDLVQTMKFQIHEIERNPNHNPKFLRCLKTDYAKYKRIYDNMLAEQAPAQVVQYQHYSADF